MPRSPPRRRRRRRRPSDYATSCSTGMATACCWSSDAAMRAAAAREPDRLRRENGDAAPRIEVVDRAAFEAIGRLVAAGLIAFVGEPQSLHRSPALLAGRGDRLRERARDLLAQARRKLRMATLLAEGGFDPEARPPLLEAIALAVGAGAALADE